MQDSAGIELNGRKWSSNKQQRHGARIARYTAQRIIQKESGWPVSNLLQVSSLIKTAELYTMDVGTSPSEGV